MYRALILPEFTLEDKMLRSVHRYMYIKFKNFGDKVCIKIKTITRVHENNGTVCLTENKLVCQSNTCIFIRIECGKILCFFPAFDQARHVYSPILHIDFVA